MAFALSFPGAGRFSFRPLAAADFELLARWHARPHIERWYGKRGREQVAARYCEKLTRPWLAMFVVLEQGREIGYIQTYHAPEVGGGWWPDESPGTWGIDLFIGEPDRLHRGAGPAFVRTFTDALLAKGEVKKVIADPSPENRAAIRAYEKAGFAPNRELQTPDGPALLMVREQ